MVKFLDLKKQYLSIKGEINNAINSVIEDTAFVGGKYVKLFEEAFAEYVGVNHCIGVANGTDALEIAIESLRLPKGSEIIVPANSFIATSEAVTRAGHKVRFCDNNEYYTLDIEDLRKQISKDTSAIIAVHLYGQPCMMDEILSIAAEYKLKVIEDAAQAHGAKYKNKRVGTFGDVACFSFYPGKNLGAYGDGGAIVTYNDEIAFRCRMISNHGSKEKYLHEFEGRNSRLDAIQASILFAKLPHLEKWNHIRNEAAYYYNTTLSNITGIETPKIMNDVFHVFHLFVLRLQNRDNLAKYLKENDIDTGIHYPISLPKLNAYSYINQETHYMNAVKWDSLLLSLPMGDHLTNADCDEVVDSIKRYFEK